MTGIESWVLGYLFNSLWQIPLLFAAAWLAARALRGLGAAAVHRVWVCAFVLQSILPACPAQPSRWLNEILTLIGYTQPNHVGDVAVTFGAGTGTAAIHLPFQLPLVLTSVYALVLLYFVARLIWRFQITQAIRQQTQLLILKGEAASYWQHCRIAFSLDDAQIATSRGISSPMTMGVRKRLILLPEDMAESLPDEDLRAVIAHESAHVRRRDFAWNLLYELISLPADYHPVLWLTRSRLVESREMVCDEMAAEAVAGRDRYVRSLLRLASIVVHRTPTVAPHAIGIFDANTFERRIMKLTADRKELRGTRRAVTLAACFVCGLGTCVSAMALHTGVNFSATDKGAAQDQKKRTTVTAEQMAGHVRNKVTPVYPVEAKEAKIQGEVVLHAVINKEGSVENLQVLSGPKELTASAIDAVHQWTYEPYLLNGNPVEVETTIHVNYSLTK